MERMATLQGSDSAELNSHLQPSASRSVDVPLTGPIVMKFGGTSVADADAITRVVSIVKAARDSSGLPPVVIVSAMSGVTDRLLELTASAERRRDAHVLNGVAELSRRYFEAIERLLPADVANGVLVEVDAQLDDLRALLKATG